MKQREHSLWPFRPQLSIVAALIILFGLLLLIVLLRVTLDWPSQTSETAVLLGIFLLSLLPILLVLIDTLVERGGVIEYQGVKIDFSKAQMIDTVSLTIPTNIGVPAQPIYDSGSVQILDALKQASGSESVIVDLEEGQAWWETRLLVLLAGAVRHNQPKIIVFVGTNGGIKKTFQGWAPAQTLLPLLLNAHPKYALSYHTALAAHRLWELVEPKEKTEPQPVLPAWVPLGLATRYQWMALDGNTGLPNKFFAEQLLALELGEKIEAVETPKTINLVRLDELFKPVLHKEAVDESWSSERQLDLFFENDNAYIAITQKGQFKALASRLSILNTLVGGMIKKK